MMKSSGQRKRSNKVFGKGDLADSAGGQCGLSGKTSSSDLLQISTADAGIRFCRNRLLYIGNGALVLCFHAMYTIVLDILSEQLPRGG